MPNTPLSMSDTLVSMPNAGSMPATPGNMPDTSGNMKTTAGNKPGSLRIMRGTPRNIRGWSMTERLGSLHPQKRSIPSSGRPRILSTVGSIQVKQRTMQAFGPRYMPGRPGRLSV